MRKALILLIGIPFLLSCEALKKSICDQPTVTVYDTVTFEKHIPVYDTTKIELRKEYRDTVAIFKGAKIFVGSSTDSLSSKDSVRYFKFEIFNYGSENYLATPEKYLNIHFDLEINNIIMFRDTVKLENLEIQGSQYFTFHFPAAWFIKNTDQFDYHYRIAIKDNSGNIKDVYYPIPLNPKLPEKKYDEVTGDTVIYWAKPTVIDTNIILKRPVYAYKDSLIYIDDIIGCRVYSHIFFGGNKIYSFVADTCTKRLYSDAGITDNNTSGITGFIVKASNQDVDTATLRLYVNDTIIDHMSFDQADSVYIYLITKSFSDIKTITFESDYDVTIHAALLNNMDLLSQPVNVTGQVLKNPSGSFIFDKPTGSAGLIANWKFNGNGNDETGRYPLTMSATGLFITPSDVEGSAYMSANYSTYYGYTTVPFGNQFSISFWFKTTNENSDSRPLFGNSKVYYPDGYVLYMDEINKMFRFVTSDGTNEGRKYLMTDNNMWLAGKWTNAIICVDKLAGTGKFYINGINKTRATSTGVFKSFKDNLPLYIGRSSEASQFWGYLDDFRIYDKVLSQDEVNQVYNKANLPASSIINVIKFTIQ